MHFNMVVDVIVLCTTLMSRKELIVAYINRKFRHHGACKHQYQVNYIFFIDAINIHRKLQVQFRNFI